MRVIEPLVIVVEDENSLPLPRRRERRTPRLLSRVVGLLATVGFHLLVSSPLLLGTSAQKPHPRPVDGLGSVALDSEGNEQEAMILLDLSGISEMQQDARSIPERQSENTNFDNLRIVIASVEMSPPPELAIEDAEEAEVSTEQAGDPAGAAALFGRYMGQIAARIERSWMRPRSPIAGGRFDCRARISQDRKGRVLSVELQDCSEDPRWRESLTSAILHASPLSAPPEQWLLAETVTLNFSADQYEAGRSQPHLYAPEEERVARSTQASHVPDGLAGPGDYDLTMEGGQLRWKRKGSSAAASK